MIAINAVDLLIFELGCGVGPLLCLGNRHCSTVKLNPQGERDLGLLRTHERLV